MATRSELLARVRSRQQTLETAAAAPAKPLRIILEFEQARDPQAVAAEIRERLAIEASVVPLSAAHREGGNSGDDALAEFLATTIIGIEAADVSDSPFELGYAIADATGALTADALN